MRRSVAGPASMAAWMAKAYGVICLSVMACLTAWPTPAWADKMIDTTKTIEWSIPKVPPATDTTTFGRYDWNLTAVTDDEDRVPPEINKNDKNNGSWLLVKGLPADPRTSGESGGPINVEPDAKSTVTFQALAPKGAAGGPGTITSSMHEVLNADLEPPDGKSQSAQATATASMTISSGTITSAEVAQKGAATVTLDAKSFKGTVPFGANTGNMKLKDPLSIILTDLTLGASVQQTLFVSDFEAAVNGEWSWDSSGIGLSAPLDGVSSVSIALDFPSSWITDPALVNSQVSLVDGVFSATGLFAGLPWAVTPTSAELPAGSLNSIAIDYQVPVNLLDDTHLYEESLTSDLAGQVAVAAPEPSAVVLVISGLGVLALFRFPLRLAADRVWRRWAAAAGAGASRPRHHLAGVVAVVARGR